MRWFVGILILLSILSGIAMLVHAQEKTIGSRLLQEMEHEGIETRGAIQLTDFEPADTQVVNVVESTAERGDGNPPGLDAGQESPRGQRWLHSSDVTFTWRKADAQDNDELRAAFGEDGSACVQARKFLQATGYYAEATDIALRQAAADERAMADEELFVEWLEADQAILEQATDVRRAVFVAELLLARDEPGPVINFFRKGYSIYLFGAEADAKGTWCRLEAFDKSGAAAWSGRLSIQGKVDPARVRNLAVWMSDEASRK